MLLTALHLQGEVLRSSCINLSHWEIEILHLAILTVPSTKHELKPKSPPEPSDPDELNLVLSMQHSRGLIKSHCSTLLKIGWSQWAVCLQSGSDTLHSWDAGQATEVLPVLRAQSCVSECVFACLCPSACVRNKASRPRSHSISIHWQKLYIQSHERDGENETWTFHNTLNTLPASQHRYLKCVYLPHYSWLSCMSPRVPTTLPPLTISTTQSRSDERPFQ